jgi:hypothetical protein
VLDRVAETLLGRDEKSTARGIVAGPQGAGIVLQRGRELGRAKAPLVFPPALRVVALQEQREREIPVELRELRGDDETAAEGGQRAVDVPDHL